MEATVKPPSRSFAALYLVIALYSIGCAVTLLNRDDVGFQFSVIYLALATLVTVRLLTWVEDLVRNRR
jgi:hypothetical protein